MAGEQGTTVEFDSGHTDDGEDRDASVTRYEQEQEDPANAGTKTGEQDSSSDDNSDSQNTDEDNSTDNEDDSTSESEDDNTEDDSDDNSNDDSGEESDEESGEESEEESNPFQPYFDEFANYGELSEDSYKALEEKGIPRSTVDDYIQTRSAVSDAIQTAAFATVGGKENYEAMAEWARANLKKEDLQKFNREVDSGDPNRAVQAVNGLKSQYDDALGSESPSVTDNADTSSGAEPGYKSQREMQADMADPRYGTDPAFRERVLRKLAKSNF